MQPLPPGQQLAAPDKWPLVGERRPREDGRPWTITVCGAVESPRVWTLEEVASLGAVETVVDVHCVTRWSKPGMRFRGPLLATLVASSRPRASAQYVSLVARSDRNHSTSLRWDEAVALGALCALAAEGQPLEVEHGGPVRIVTPGRYFYKSLKWLERVELLEADRLGYWEAEAGYHNHADPWREERYLAASVSRAEMRQILADRDVSGRDLRSLQAAGHDLAGLRAADALLRNADFRGAKLAGSDFRRANLSNARLAGADLRDADLSGADCEGADFSGADLRGARLDGASLFGASFCELTADGRAERMARFDSGAVLDPAALEMLTPGQRAAVAARLARPDR